MAKTKRERAKNIQHSMRGNDDVVTSSLHDEVAANAQMVTVVVTLADTLEDFSALTGDAFDKLLMELRHIPESQRELVAMQERAFGQLVEVAALLSKQAEEETDPTKKKALEDAIASMTMRADRIKGNIDTRPHSFKEAIGARYLGLRPQVTREKGFVGGLISSSIDILKHSFPASSSAADLIQHRKEEINDTSVDRVVENKKRLGISPYNFRSGGTTHFRQLNEAAKGRSSSSTGSKGVVAILEKIYHEVVGIRGALHGGKNIIIPPSKSPINEDILTPGQHRALEHKREVEATQKRISDAITVHSLAAANIPGSMGASVAASTAPGDDPQSLADTPPEVPTSTSPIKTFLGFKILEKGLSKVKRLFSKSVAGVAARTGAAGIAGTGGAAGAAGAAGAGGAAAVAGGGTAAASAGLGALATGGAVVGGLAAGLYAGDKIFNTSITEGGSGNLADTWNYAIGKSKEEKAAIRNQEKAAHDRGYASYADWRRANATKAEQIEVRRKNLEMGTAIENAKDKAEQIQDEKDAAMVPPTIINNTTNSSTGTKDNNPFENFFPGIRPTDNSFLRFQDKRETRVL